MDFLRAILDDPEADAPRLVYADHLGERGDARGELISLQVALARGGLDDRGSRMERLVRSCWDELAAPALDAGIPRFCVRRGFVEAVHVVASRLEELPALMSRYPILELRLLGRRADTDSLAGMREMLKLRVLDLRSLGLGDRRCMEILRSPHLANISTLILQNNGLSMASVQALTRAARHLPSLECVALGGNALGQDAEELLMSSPLRHQLLEVSLDASDELLQAVPGEVWLP